jgi:hypothetical protein
MTLTTYLKNKVLDFLFGRGALTVPDVLYLGLCTGCTLAGVVTGEPSGDGYARVAFYNNDLTTIWSPAVSKRKTNANGPLIFSTATGSWGTLTVGFIADASSGGNVWNYATLSSSITPVAGIAPVIIAGDFAEALT